MKYLRQFYAYTIWDWAMNPNPLNHFGETGGYSVINKPAEKVINKFFSLL